VALVGGSASYDTSTLALGAHSITAGYSGDIRSDPSTSAAVPVVVAVPPPPPIRITGVTNGASFQPGVAAPNTILSLFGSNLSCAPKPLVLIGTAPAEVLGFADSQINFVVPPGAGPGPVALQVGCGANRSDSYFLSGSAAAPAIFTAAANGLGQASVLNPDGSLNGPVSPAARGGYISVFGTGFGIYNSPDSSGLLWLSQPVTVFFADAQTSVQFAGAAPGYTTGLQQINVRIPSDAPSGSAVPIRMVTGGVSTPAGVTVAIE
jgi:uncharacterized protein (TIGR03437 family)